MNNDAIVVELDKLRTLKFRRKELKMIEKTFGKKISKIEFAEMGIDDLSKIINLGLVHEDPELTLENTEQLIDEYPYYGILVQKAMEAFTIAMNGPKLPEAEQVEGTPEEKN